MAEDEQKLIEELQAELAKLKVADLLLQTLYSVSSLGYHRLSGETEGSGAGEAGDRGPPRARAGARGSVPDDALRDFGQVLANLQLAYAAAAEDPAPS